MTQFECNRNGKLVECPGCGYNPGDSRDVESHLGTWLYARAASMDPETVRRLNKSNLCELYLARKNQGPARTRVGYRSELKNRSRTPPKRSMPEALRDFSKLEVEGISTEVINATGTSIMAIPGVAAYCQNHKIIANTAQRFFVHLAYSIYVGHETKQMDVEFSENSLCIGVGDDVMRIDDVRPFGVLWRASLDAGLSLKDALVYIFFAHDLVRPAIIHAIANIVKLERHKPDADYLATLLNRVLRRHAPNSKKIPKKKDALQLGSTQTRAHLYGGTAVSRRKLRNQWSVVHDMVEELVTLVAKDCKYSEVTSAIASHGIEGMGVVTGYWINHFARLLTPSSSGVVMKGTIVIDPDGCRQLYSMGEGSKALTLLGVTKQNAHTALPALCRAVESLSEAIGYPKTVTEAQIVISACESHRRNGLKKVRGSICRRAGL